MYSNDQILQFIFSINWGSVSDFLILGTTISIAYFVYNADKKRTLDSQIFERELNKPIIGLFKKNSKKYYSIHNYGKGAALNIITAYKSLEKSKDWQQYVNCYSLKDGDSIDLFWKDGGYEWIVKYEDTFGQIFISTCKHDTINVEKISDKNIHHYKDFLEYIKDNICDIKKIDRHWRLIKTRPSLSSK